MKRNSILTVFMLLAAVFALASCENETPRYEPFDIIEVSFDIEEAEEKTLTADIDTKTAYYSYTAVPLFSLASGNPIYGETDQEKILGPTGTESAGRFTQGKWHFCLYAYNAAGALVRNGEIDIYLTKTAGELKESIPIMIYRTAERTGNVHFNFLSTNVSGENPYVEITPIRNGETQPVRRFYADSINADNSATFDFSLTGLKSGMWEFAIRLFNGDQVNGGAAISTYVLGGDTTEISGSIYPTEWIDAGFSIIMPQPIEGTIGSDITVGIGDINFKWTVEGGYAKTWKWYVDGVLKGTETKNTWKYRFERPGSHSVTCVAIGADGKEMGTSRITVSVKSPEKERAVYKWFDPKKSTITENLPSSKFTGTPLMRILMQTPQGVIVYSGYPALTEQGTGWKGTVPFEQSGTSYQMQLKMDNGKLTAAMPVDYSGTVVVEVSM